jgi:hypothetical protein
MGRPGAALTAIAIAVLLAAPLASAEELSREEYVARAEPICKTNVEANKRIFKGAKGEVNAGELKKASKHFSRAATAFAGTIAQLEAVPRPPADEAKLAKWLDYLRAGKGFIGEIGIALARGDKRKAESVSVKLNRNSTRANNAVLGFGFDYCRIDPARFG